MRNRISNYHVTRLITPRNSFYAIRIEGGKVGYPDNMQPFLAFDLSRIHNVIGKRIDLPRCKTSDQLMFSLNRQYGLTLSSKDLIAEATENTLTLRTRVIGNIFKGRAVFEVNWLDDIEPAMQTIMPTELSKATTPRHRPHSALATLFTEPYAKAITLGPVDGMIQGGGITGRGYQKIFTKAELASINLDTYFQTNVLALKGRQAKTLKVNELDRYNGSADLVVLHESGDHVLAEYYPTSKDPWFMFDQYDTGVETENGRVDLQSMLYNVDFSFLLGDTLYRNVDLPVLSSTQSYSAETVNAVSHWLQSHGYPLEMQSGIPDDEETLYDNLGTIDGHRAFYFGSWVFSHLLKIRVRERGATLGAKTMTIYLPCTAPVVEPATFVQD